jgi:predicted enzyme related to lactoylglutathione lyase
VEENGGSVVEAKRVIPGIGWYAAAWSPAAFSLA